MDNILLIPGLAERFNPLLAFGAYRPLVLDSMFQTETEDTAAVVDSAVGRINDAGTGDNPMTQSSASLRGVLRVTDGNRNVQLDKVDDTYAINYAGPVVGTMILATELGTQAYEVDIPTGVFAIAPGRYFPGTRFYGMVISNTPMNANDQRRARRYFRDYGAGDNYGGVTNLTQFWRGHSRITSFPLIDTSSGETFTNAWRGCSGLTSFPLIDTSSGESFSEAWRGCSGLTSFPLLNFSSGTSFALAWMQCTSLTSFPANAFDTCTATNFASAFTTTALSETSIDGILVSINSNLTNNGTFTQSGGTKPSATGETAITAMRGRGWTVNVTGGF